MLSGLPDGSAVFHPEVLPLMIRVKAGSIINISSVQGLVAGRNSAAYTTMKHALLGLTRSVACDYGVHNIRCNAICPGAIATRISPPPGSELHQRQISKTFLGRIGQPIEVAHAALFLASDESSYITGAVLAVDGGWTAMCLRFQCFNDNERFQNDKAFHNIVGRFLFGFRLRLGRKFIVADEFPAMQVLAEKLKTEENISSKVVSQKELPDNLSCIRSRCRLYSQGLVRKCRERVHRLCPWGRQAHFAPSLHQLRQTQERPLVFIPRRLFARRRRQSRRLQMDRGRFFRFGES